MPGGEEKELARGRHERVFRSGTVPSRKRKVACAAVGLTSLLGTLALAACGGGVTSPPSVPTQPSPPPTVSVSVAPNTAAVLLGNSASFSASVTGATNPAVVWAVNGTPGGNASMGTINSSGNYQAPTILPAMSVVQVQATSQADAASRGSASVSIMSDLQVQVAPAAVNVATGATQTFTATVASAGHPATAVTWSLSGAGCTSTACGTITSAGLYTAPAARPQPPEVSVTAASVADQSKAAAALVNVVAAATTVSVSPSNATLALEGSLTFTASFTGPPLQGMTWSVNGIAGGNAQVGTISNAPAQNGLYLAPVNMPSARQVTITAASAGNPAIAGSATLQLTSNIAVNISPPSAVRVAGARQSLSASVGGTSNPQVAWTVNGVPNGSALVGLICLPGSNPCQPPAPPALAGAVDYAAPAAVPSPPQVTVTALSVADPGRSASAVVTIVAEISVGVAPPSFTIPPGQSQTLVATVLGTADQRVTWDVDGSPNGSIAKGLICLPASTPCQAPNGPFAGGVEFRAPATAPVPNVVSLRATSGADPASQTTALVTISTAPFVTAIIPASVLAGAAQPFGLRVEGVQLVGPQPGSDTSVVINGVPHPTVCPSSTECDTTLNPADVAMPGLISVSVRSDDDAAAAAASNTVTMIVAPVLQTISVIPLDSTSSPAAGMDIYVVEPTVAGSASPGEMNLLEIGLADQASAGCTLAAPPLALARPATGSVTYRVCVFGTSLDQVSEVSFFPSPAMPADPVAGNVQALPGGLLLEFDVVLSSAAAPGPRSLYVGTPNLDMATLTAAVQVK